MPKAAAEYTDEELAQAASVQLAEDQPEPDASAVSDEELARIAGVQLEPAPQQLEGVYQGQERQKKQLQAQQIAEEQRQQQVLNDPVNWTADKLQEFFKLNPPQTLPEKAQADAAVQAKQQQEKAITDQALVQAGVQEPKLTPEQKQRQQFDADLSKTIGESVKKVGSGIYGLQEAIGATVKWAGDATMELSTRGQKLPSGVKPEEHIQGAARRITFKVGSFTSQLGKDAIEHWRQRKLSPELKPDPEFWSGSFMEHNSWQKAVALGAGAIPSLGAATAITLTTGNPWAGAGALGLVYGSTEYEAARESGKSFDRSSLVGAANVVGNTILERLPLATILKAGKPITKAAVVGLQEGAEEYLQQLWSNAVAKFGYDPTRKYTEGVVESFVGGVVSGGVIGGLTPGGAHQVDEFEARMVKEGFTPEQVASMRENITDQILLQGEQINTAIEDRAQPQEGQEKAPAETAAAPAEPKGRLASTMSVATEERAKQAMDILKASFPHEGFVYEINQKEKGYEVNVYERGVAGQSGPEGGPGAPATEAAGAGELKRAAPPLSETETNLPPAAPAPTVDPETTEKQPWEMTSEEWEREFEATRPNAQGTGGGGPDTGIGRSVKGAEHAFKRLIARQDFLKMGLKDIPLAEGEPELGVRPARHYDVIKKALESGKNIPPEVLAEYPDLSKVEKAAGEAATSPENALPEPTEAQKEAGNFQKGHVSIHGMDISIEYPRGAERSGVSKSGKKWTQKMAHHYGYIKSTTGSDGEQVDVFIGPNPESEKVFVVAQVKPTGEFGEYKALIGFKTRGEARVGYLANYPKDFKGLGTISEMPVEQFKEWVNSNATKKPAAKSVAPAPEPGSERSVLKPELQEEMVESAEKVLHIGRGKKALPLVEIAIGQHEGKWYVSYEYHTSNPGGASPFYGAFPTKEGAVLEGVKQLRAVVEHNLGRADTTPTVAREFRAIQKAIQNMAPASKAVPPTAPEPGRATEANYAEVLRQLKEQPGSDGNRDALVKFGESLEYDPLRVYADLIDSGVYKNEALALVQTRWPNFSTEKQAPPPKSPTDIPPDIYKGGFTKPSRVYTRFLRSDEGNIISDGRIMELNPSPENYKDFLQKAITGDSRQMKAQEMRAAIPSEEATPHELPDLPKYHVPADKGQRLSEQFVYETPKGLVSLNAVYVRYARKNGYEIYTGDPARTYRLVKNGKTAGAIVGFDPSKIQYALERAGVELPTAEEKGGGGESGVQGIVPRGDIQEMSSRMWQVELPKEPEVKERINKTQILQAMEEQFDVPIRTFLTHKKSKAEGFYKIRPEIIRMKRWGELEPATHEVAHHIDKTLKKSLGANWRNDIVPQGAKKMALKELQALDYDQKQRRTSEGFAEYMRHYITDTGEAQTRAPVFHQAFQVYLQVKNQAFQRKLELTKQMYHTWKYQGALNRMLSQIDFRGEHTEPPLMKKFWRAVDFLADKFEDEFSVLKKVEKKLGLEIGKNMRPDESPFAMATYMKQKANGIARFFIETGAVDEYGNKIGPSLVEILKPILPKDISTGDVVGGIPLVGKVLQDKFFRDENVQAKIRPFIAYWVARRGMHLETRRGMESGFDVADMKHIIEKYQSPAFDQVARDLTDWSNHLVDWVVRAGGLSPDAAEAFRILNPIYAPFKRAFLDELAVVRGTGGLFSKSKAFKEIKGSGRPILNPLEVLAQSASELIRRSHKIRLANVIVNLAEKEGAGGIVDEIPLATKATSFKVEQIKQQLKALGADIPQDIADELLTVFQHSANYTGKDNVVVAWRKGELHLYEIDPAVYRSLQAVEPMQIEGAMKLFSMFTRLRRLGATGINPSFGWIRNVLKDAATYATFSKKKSATPIDPMKGIILDLRDSDKPGTSAYRFKAAGGDISTSMGYDRAQTMAVIDDALLKEIGKKGKVLRIAKHPIDALRRLVNIPELGPRMVELEQSMKRYEKEHPEWSPHARFIQAFNDAQDVTINFSKSGSWGKQLNQVSFAFNPSIQGLQKFYRQMRIDPAGTALRGAIWISLASIAFWYRNKDEEWYQNLPNEAKYKNIYVEYDDQIIRVPIPYDLGVIFSALPVSILDVDHLNDPEKYEGLIKLATSQIPNPWPPDIIGPVWDVNANKTYLGSPIESKGMKYLPSEYRVRPYTAEWAKQLSKGMNKLFETVGSDWRLSPVQLEYLVQDYSGGLMRNIPQIKTVKELADLPVVGTLFQRMPEEPQSWVNKFYDRYGPLQEKKAAGTITKQEQVELNRLQTLYNSAVKPSTQRVRKLQAKDDREGLRREYIWLGKQLRNSRWLQ